MDAKNTEATPEFSPAPAWSGDSWWPPDGGGVVDDFDLAAAEAEGWRNMAVVRTCLRALERCPAARRPESVRTFTCTMINYLLLLLDAEQDWCWARDWVAGRGVGGRGPGFWPKVSTLADRLGVTPDTVRRAERELERLGILAVTSRRNGRRDGLRGRDGCLVFVNGVVLAPVDELVEMFGGWAMEIALEEERYRVAMERARGLADTAKGRLADDPDACRLVDDAWNRCRRRRTAEAFRDCERAVLDVLMDAGVDGAAEGVVDGVRGGVPGNLDAGPREAGISDRVNGFQRHIKKIHTLEDSKSASSPPAPRTGDDEAAAGLDRAFRRLAQVAGLQVPGQPADGGAGGGRRGAVTRDDWMGVRKAVARSGRSGVGKEGVLVKPPLMPDQDPVPYDPLWRIVAFLNLPGFADARKDEGWDGLVRRCRDFAVNEWGYSRWGWDMIGASLGAERAAVALVFTLFRHQLGWVHLPGNYFARCVERGQARRLYLRDSLVGLIMFLDRGGGAS